MTEEQGVWQDDCEQPGYRESQGRAGVAEMLAKGSEAANQFMEELKISAGTTEAVVGTILGCLTVGAFTKAWPRLSAPVSAAGYLVGGYAAYRLVKAAFDRREGDSASEPDSAAECGGT